MRIKSLVASFAILFAPAMAAAAPAPAPTLMTPTGPWNVEYADSMCLLSRPYGKDRSTSLVLKPSMLGDDLEIIVTQATTSVRDRKSGRAYLAVAGGSASGNARFTAYSSAKTRLLRINADEDAKIALSAVRGSLSIDAKHESRHLFAIPGIDQALPVLADCIAQLRKVYKVSEADLAAIVTTPAANVYSFFSTNDYPAEALSNGQTGTVGVLVWVEATGRVSTCEIIESSAAKVLEKATCNILQRRARFTPAKDAVGNAVRAPSFTRIMWIM